MCSPAVCRQCNKATYSGCGRHVELVLRGVPNHRRCACPPPERTSLFGWLGR